MLSGGQRFGNGKDRHAAPVRRIHVPVFDGTEDRTDLHGSLDCVADWRGPERLCYDMLLEPDMVHEMLAIANEHFSKRFDTIREAHPLKQGLKHRYADC